MFRFYLITLIFAAVTVECWAQLDTWAEEPCSEPQDPCPNSPGAECRLMCWKSNDESGKACVRKYFLNDEMVSCHTL